MKKSVMKITGAVLVFALIFGSMAGLLRYRYSDSITSIRRFYQLEDNTVDLLGLGTSHVYEGLCPAVLYREYGIAAYDLCAPAQAVWNSYYYFVEALKTQTPRAVVFDVYMLNTNSEYDTTANAIKTTFGMKWSQNKLDAMRAAFPEDSFPDILLNFYQYHTRYAELSEEDLLPDNGNSPYFGDSYKGFYTYDTVQEQEMPDVASFSGTRTLAEKHEQYYRAIIELAIANQIPIYIVSIPYVVASDTQKTVRAAEAIALSYNSEYVRFIDFNQRYEEIGLDFSTDFSGSQHLNRSGAIKFTSYFGQILQSELDFPDRRQDEAFASWEENAAIFYRMTDQAQLQKEIDIYAYADTLRELDEQYCVIIVKNTLISKESAASDANGEPVFHADDLSDEEKESILSYRQKVRDITFSSATMQTLFDITDDAVHGGAWILQDGQLQMLGSNENGFSWYHSFNGRNNVALRASSYGDVDDTYYRCELLYGEENYGANTGVTIFVYDTYLNRLADCVTFDTEISPGQRA